MRPVPETADRPIKVRDYRPIAEALLPENTWNYVEGGAGDEHSLGWNEQSWQDFRLWPRTLVDVSTIDTALTLLGSTLAHPIALAPTAAHSLYHPAAEQETLAGAGAGEALAVMSTLGSTAVGDLGRAATGPWWFQLYVQADRDFTADLVRRAAIAGATAIVLTVDTPLLGARDRDRRGGGHTVDAMSPPNVAPAQDQVAADAPLHQRVYNPFLDPSLTWDTLSWLVEISSLPVLTKGVVRPDDARRAVDCGAAGIVVSNHGGRNLDTTVATAQALPGVVEAVAGQTPVLVDGGIRRGTDIAKALCLGADAVLVGRPAIWALAAGGADGVTHMLDILRSELLMAMGLLGAPTLQDLTRDLLYV